MNEQHDAPLDDQASPLAADPEADAEAASVAVDDGKGNKMVPLSALIASKRDFRTAKKRIAELEPIAARATEVDERLNKAQPVIDAIITNPKLRAEALRIAGGEGTRTTPLTVEQPADDDEARGHAEDYGMYLGDGVTPDTARARRALNRIAGISKRQTEEAIRPLAGLTLNEKANSNLRDAVAQVDTAGVPLATQESIMEVARQIPQHLLANPQVIELIVNNAIGVDRRKGRSPQPPAEPLFMERQSGFRRSEPAVTAEDRRALAKLGLTEKDFTDAGSRLNTAVSTRRGIALE